MRNAEGTQKQNQSSSLLPAHIHQQLPALLLLQPAASYTVHKLSAQDVLSRANPVQLCACREVTRSSHTPSPTGQVIRVIYPQHGIGWELSTHPKC